MTASEGNQGRISEAWVYCQGGLHIFAVFFWHTEGWTPQNAVLIEATPRNVAKSSRLHGSEQVVTRYCWKSVTDFISKQHRPIMCEVWVKQIDKLQNKLHKPKEIPGHSAGKLRTDEIEHRTREKREQHEHQQAPGSEHQQTCVRHIARYPGADRADTALVKRGFGRLW